MGGSIPENLRRRQVAGNLRFYADMRFKQLTLLLGGLTFAGAGVAQFDKVKLTDSLDVRTALAVLSLVFTATMWIMEVRSTVSWFAHRRIAPDLWPLPTEAWFQQLNATNAVLFLHGFIYAAWYFLAWDWYPQGFFRLIFGALGGTLVVYSVLNYWPLKHYREEDPGSSDSTVDGATVESEPGYW